MFGDRNATEEMMIAALNKANAQFVLKLEKGLDTYVGASSL